MRLLREAGCDPYQRVWGATVTTPVSAYFERYENGRKQNWTGPREQFSIRHRIRNEIKGQTECEIRPVVRVTRLFSPFPRVAKVAVVSHDDHEATIVIEDSAYGRCTGTAVIAFPVVIWISGGSSTLVGHLEDLLNRVDNPKDQVIHGDVLNLVIGEDLSDFTFEIGPLISVPEVVDEEKAAGEQIAPQTLYLRWRKGHATNFEHVQEGEAAELRIV